MKDEMESGMRMCTSIKDVIKCYENPAESCSAKIYKDFVKLLIKFASQMLKMYMESPGVMPDC